MQTPEGINVVDGFCRILEDGHYGSFDSLRRSMLGRDGARAAMKQDKSLRKKAREEKAAQVPAPAIVIEQGGLFE